MDNNGYKKSQFFEENFDKIFALNVDEGSIVFALKDGDTINNIHSMFIPAGYELEENPQNLKFEKI